MYLCSANKIMSHEMKIAKFFTDEERQRIETAKKQLFALAAEVIQQDLFSFGILLQFRPFLSWKR